MQKQKWKFGDRAKIRRMTREQRTALLSTAAAMAESEYKTNRDLTGFDAFGEEDGLESH